jgi:hypothetical protein
LWKVPDGDRSFQEQETPEESGSRRLDRVLEEGWKKRVPGRVCLWGVGMAVGEVPERRIVLIWKVPEWKPVKGVEVGRRVPERRLVLI